MAERGVQFLQQAVNQGLELWLAESAPAAPPPGMKTITVPADLPEEYVRLLERAAQEIVKDLAEGLDTISMASKKAKIR